MIWTGMCRVLGSSFELPEHRPTMLCPGNKISREMAVGLYLAGQRKTGRAVRGDYALKTLVARKVEQDSRVIRIILDDQQQRLTRSDVCPGRPRCAPRGRSTRR